MKDRKYSGALQLITYESTCCVTEHPRNPCIPEPAPYRFQEANTLFLDFIGDICFSKEPKPVRYNIELSRPAVRSPATAAFTFPSPRFQPGVKGSASTTCYVSRFFKIPLSQKFL